MEKGITRSVLLLIVSIFLGGVFMTVGVISETEVLSTLIWVVAVTLCLMVAAAVIAITGIIIPMRKKVSSVGEKLNISRDTLNVASDRMNGGLVLTDEELFIVSLNRRAMQLLQTGTNCVGSDIRDVAGAFGAKELFERAKSGEHVEELVESGNLEYQIKVSSIVSDGRVSGYVMLIFDDAERERSEKIRREFTANVSHELKTPLHSILGCAELLSSSMVKPEDVGEFSGQIYAEAKRMVRLIEDIMNLSKLDEGSLDLQRSEVDLFEIAKGAVKSLEGEAEKAKVSISAIGEGAVMNGIPHLLSGILLNLCDNAIKYNREGGSVEVSVKSEDGSVVLSVADTGIGIPSEHQTRVFERFYRVDKSHSKEVGGTGLGLSIVKHSARIHGAKIEMQSTPGAGTTITLRFPKSM